MKQASLPLAVRLLRFFYATISTILPRLAVNLLWKLFTPRRRPLRPTDEQFLETAEPFTFVSHSALKGEAVFLQGYRWGQGHRTVLLVHGWEGGVSDFRDLVPPLVAAGFAVTSFDMPAHGRSPGTQTNLLEMKQALLDYGRSIGLPYAVVAHSLGGTAAALLLAEEAVGVEKFVFLASPITARATFDIGFSQLRVPAQVQQQFYTRLSRHLGQSIDNFAFASRPQLRARRVLAVYDTADELLPVAAVRRYLGENPGVEQLLVSGIGHYRLLRNPAVLSAVLQFVAAEQQPNNIEPTEAGETR
ncbi:alpha/beta fold hydrolase [Hymenobacter sp.]|uniref:alpha/beta hydrolase n=1 Tax=Hymenobacter sp. TaxID=1898978 RepID=UPI00286B138D|nr:alpha/beta fold hydrolase [Hymenobacter sp.]